MPALVLDSGLPITESLLVVLWLETQRPTPSLLGTAPERVLSQAGVAMGAIDAAANIVITRRSAPGFDDSAVGPRRRRSIVQALERLEAQPPVLSLPAVAVTAVAADLATITSVVLLDYLRFRFAAAPWASRHAATRCLEHPGARTGLFRRYDLAQDAQTY